MYAISKRMANIAHLFFITYCNLFLSINRLFNKQHEQIVLNVINQLASRLALLALQTNNTANVFWE